MTADITSHPLGKLDRDELDLVLRFVLASGSLKELGRRYGVSYPTIRARLDRLIEKLEELRAGRTPDPIVEELARLVESGELSVAGARRLRELCRQGPQQKGE